MKPYSEACEENRQPILQVIRPLLEDCSSLLEIGSGTGQHAVYFAAELPHLAWHTSDCREHHPGIEIWLREAHLDNTRMPLELDVSASTWPDRSFDAVFSANTTHIMHWRNVVDMFNGVGRVLNSAGKFLLYGPFNYHGTYTSDSNARFDAFLRQRDPGSGIRDFDDLDRLAGEAGLELVADYGMPVNNRLLYWRKK